jgi:predicted RNase H-like HicB family nuclease
VAGSRRQTETTLIEKGATGGQTVRFTIETEQEVDGRWIAEVRELSGVLAYGRTRDEAIARVEALGLRVLADRLENGDEARTSALQISFAAL